MVMVMLDLKEQLQQYIAYSSTEQRDNRFYVQGGRRDDDTLKEKGIRVYPDTRVDLARYRRKSTVGWGFEWFEGFIAKRWYVR